MIGEKYKVVIVDDERTAMDTLANALTVYPDMDIKGMAATGSKGRKLIMELRPDLLFLDVELPDILGLNLLNEIRNEVSWDMKVVFYTSYDKYLLQALRESAFDFLLKPFEQDELHTIIERFRRMKSSGGPVSSFGSFVDLLLPGNKVFMINTVTGFKLLRLEEIGYFEYLRDKRQWQVALFNQTKIGLKRNTRAEDIMGYSDVFLQISQSVIINLNYLAAIEGKNCQLYPPFNNCDNLIISRNFMKSLQEHFLML